MGVGDFDAAAETADSIPASSGTGMTALDPRQEAYASLVRALARDGRIEQAVAITEREVEDGRPSAAFGAARAQLLVEIAEAALAIKDPQAAERIVSRLRQDPAYAAREDGWVPQPLSRVHVGLARLERSLGRPEAYAAMVASLERQARAATDDEEASLLWMQVVALLIGSGESVRAREIAERLPPGQHPWGLAFAGAAAMEAGDFETVEALIALMEKPEDRAAAKQSLLKAQIDRSGEDDPLAFIKLLSSPYERGLTLIAEAEGAWQREEQSRP
jgi:hypothetical protein